jgi:hypothetical protein
MKELRSNSSNRKNVAEQKCTKGVSPTAFWRRPSPEGAKRLPYVKRRTNNTPLSYNIGTIYTRIF